MQHLLVNVVVHVNIFTALSQRFPNVGNVLAVAFFRVLRVLLVPSFQVTAKGESVAKCG